MIDLGNLSSVWDFSSPELYFLLALGGAVGLLSGLLGVGGGVLMTPALHLLGLSMPMAVGTTLTQMVASSLTASFRHHRKNNLSFTLACFFAAPALLGVSLGRKIMVRWNNAGTANDYAGLVYVVLLVYIGFVMTRRQVVGDAGAVVQKSPGKPKAFLSLIADLKRRFLNAGPKFHIKNLGQDVSLIVPAVSGFLVGITSALTGLGGGFFYVPLMVQLLCLPFHMAVGTSVMTVLFISSAGAVSYGFADLVDFRIAALVACGSSLGAYFGASAAHYIRGQSIRRMFVALLWLAAVSMSLHLMHFSQLSNVLLFLGAFVVVGAAVWNASYHFFRSRF